MGGLGKARPAKVRRGKLGGFNVAEQWEIYKDSLRITAAKRHKSLPNHVTLDEVFSDCIDGFLRALRDYRKDKNCTLKSYISQCAIWQMSQGLRDRDWIRNRRSNPNKTDIKVKSFTAIENAVERSKNDRNQNVEDVLDRSQLIQGSKPLDTPDVKLDAHSKVASVFDLLNTIEAVCFVGYFFDEATMKEIGDLVGLSESRISQIINRAKAKVLKVFSSLPC